MLPMMQIVDKQNGNIMCQVFNFVDHMGGMTQDVAVVEKFLQVRGILKATD